MVVHRASVFLYKEFQDEARLLVGQVDQQNCKPLRERACEAIRRFQKEWPLADFSGVKYEGGVRKEVAIQTWPLWEHGEGSLATEEEIRNQGAPTPRDLGFWFLIVLAEYLQPCPSPLGNWSVLYTALATQGWKQSDCDLLFMGLPTSKLLKPRIGSKSPWPLKNTDPYWLWLHPRRARSGWLPTDEIHRLYDRLRKVKARVQVFDVRRIPGIDVDNPVVVRSYEEYLDAAYRDTLAMLSTAEEMDQGLFMSIPGMVQK